MMKMIANDPIDSCTAKIIVQTIIMIVNTPIKNDAALNPVSAHLTSTVVLNNKTETMNIVYRISIMLAGFVRLIHLSEGNTERMKMLNAP